MYFNSLAVVGIDMVNKQPTIRFQLLKHLVDHCSLVNIDRDELLDVGGIDEKFLEQKNLFSPLEPFEKMVNFIFEKTNDPLLLLKFFLQSDVSSVGPLGLLISLSENLQEAIKIFFKYRDLHGILGQMMFIEEDEHNIFFKWQHVIENHNLSACIIEYKCAWWSNLIKLCGEGGEHHLTYIKFEHKPINKNIQEYYNSFFDCPVFFDQEESVLAVSKKTLNLPIRTANKELFTSVENYIISILNRSNCSENIFEEVRNIIYFQIQTGVISREIVANRLGGSVRTLNRKLNHEGYTYSSILEDVRVEVARKYLLKTNHTILFISKSLGFFTSNTFITWFKSIFGETPSKYREKYQEAGTKE